MEGLKGMQFVMMSSDTSNANNERVHNFSSGCTGKTRLFIMTFV